MEEKMSQEGQKLVISIMAKDRPGIVAEATGAISALSGNLADLRESVLCGYFTMILIAQFPASLSQEKVQNSLQEATQSEVSVLPFQEEILGQNLPEEQIYILSSAGRDRAGLVAQVTGFCAERGVNILDLASHVEADRYTMMLQLNLSALSSIDLFKQDLEQLAQETGLELALQHHDIFRTTNEI
jgi:glycine cleavage system transcriptional repressor